MGCHFESLYYTVVVPSYHSRVRFENYSSMVRYTTDLSAKRIKYQLKIQYNEPERIYTDALGEL
jgi:hypothetical protein